MFWRADGCTNLSRIFFYQILTIKLDLTVLKTKLLTSGILVNQAEDDGDLLIVNTTIQKASDNNIKVVVVGKDIDFLKLLLTLSSPVVK